MKGRLEREVDELLASGKHDRQITPVFLRAALPRQLDFFDPREATNRLRKDQMEFSDRPSPGTTSDYYANNITLSTFYEVMTSSFYGGTRFNKRYVLDEQGRVNLRAGQSGLNGFARFEDHIKFTKPDLIDERAHRVSEVKSFRSGRSYKFRDDQMDRYIDLQMSLPEDTVINFVIYRHVVREFSHTKKNPNRSYTDEELYKALSQRTVHSVVLPFNLIYLLHSFVGKSQDVFRDEGIIRNPKNEAGAAQRYGNPGTCLRSPSANRLLFDPEQFLRDHGQNVAEYEIERVRSPERFSFDEFGVKSFPITRIFYKKYADWVEELRQKQPDTLSELIINEEIEQPQRQAEEHDGSQGTFVLDENTPF